MGITQKDKTEDADMPSNHDWVLAGFEEARYIVCVQPVCPSKCGVPMTRQRLHYQGLCKRKVENAAEQIQTLKTVWDGIVKGKYTEHSLGSFLDGEGPPKATTKTENKVQDRKWPSMHKGVFEEYQAGFSSTIWYDMLW